LQLTQTASKAKAAKEPSRPSEYTLEITKEDLKEIMHVPLQIGVGPANKGEITETLESEIIECSLAANPPNLPAIADFQLKNGAIRKFSFFELKWIKKI
jgi:hypothetical protein